MSRVTDIRYIGYSVADFDAEYEFYAQKWGLSEVAREDGLAWFAAKASPAHHSVRLRAGGKNHLDVIAFSTSTAADVDALYGKVTAASCKIIHPPRALTSPGGGYGFRFFSPDGLPFEVSSDVAIRETQVVERWDGIPLRISHAVLHAPDVKATAQFFTDVLGFKVSDWLGDFMVFLRCNEAHHRLAILPGPPCLNHIAYDMTDVDGMMAGIGRLRRLDVDIRWGPGRHTAGDNTFSYFVTPNGFAVEYTAELEEVDFENHQPQVHPPSPGLMDKWGVGVGGPQTMPHPEPDAALFQASAV